MTPDQFTLEEKYVEVGHDHSLYAQEWGNPKGRPVIYLHGGPGSGCRDSAKLIFDPSRHHVVFFDQRGAGKSLPYGSLKHNDTNQLVDDITAVAKAFRLKKFSLVGRSWGSALALVYAIRHPQNVSSLVIGGVFTGRKAEEDFLTRGGIAAFFPDVWQEYLASTPKSHRDNAYDYHLKRLFGRDPAKAKQSAWALGQLEADVMRLDDRPAGHTLDEFDPAPIRIEMHYIRRGCFITEGYIQKHAKKLTMPVTIVQGRYDAVCPPSTAYELHGLLPDSRLIWTQAGHSSSDRANFEVTKAVLTQL